MKKLLTVATTLLTMMLAFPAAAQFAKPEDAIKYRKASFTILGAHFGRVGAMATGKTPYDAKAAAENADIAMAAAREEDGNMRPQPVFSLIRTSLLESLVKFMQAGGRKIDAWTAQHACVVVPFDTPDIDPRAFFNANTLEELHRLEKTT